MQTLWDELDAVSPSFVALCQQIHLTNAHQIAELVDLLVRHPSLWPPDVSAQTLGQLAALLPQIGADPHPDRTLGVPCRTSPPH